MINPLNDVKLCEHMTVIRRNYEMLEHIWSQGANKAMFLTLHTMGNEIEKALSRLNDLQPKE